MEKVSTRKITLEQDEESLSLLGRFDEHLDLFEKHFPVQITPRGNELLLEGEEQYVEKVFFLFQELIKVIRQGHYISASEIEYALQMAREDRIDEVKNIFTDVVIVTGRGKQIKPKTTGQKKYLEAMRVCDIVISIGPAGTGKTYMALAKAIDELKNKQVQRIILTRPAVEAGEHLGFLPGDFQEKVDPYLRPIYDGLYDLLGVDTFQKYKERGIIEVAPLAYMRGRTLDDSFVILDEAQNATPEQMKMFLTRLGFESKAVITGDITQVDLPRGKVSGLVQAPEVLKGIEGIAILYLTEKDVVRHPLVQKIIEAYEQHEGKNSSQNQSQ